MKENIYFTAKAKESKTPIEETIKKLNIVYPNSSLGFLHAIYAKVDGKSPNGNGVILAKSVKKDVPKLRFTQANRNHDRELGPVLGTILDAWVNEDTQEIEIVFSFFKSLFPGHWREAQEAIRSGQLTVSFELKVDQKDIEKVDGQYRKLNHVDFDGVGLLFPGVKPAYKNAHVLQIASDIINNVFKHNNKQLVYAKAEDAVTTLEQIAKLIEKAIAENTIKGDSEMDKKTNEALLAEQKRIVIEQFGEEAVKDWSDEDFLNQDKIDALKESLKVAEEVVEQTPEPEAEVKAEEVVEKTTEVTEEPKSTEASEDEVSKSETEESSKEPEKSDISDETSSFNCECIKCGKKVTAESHCNELKCPECGSQMRREDRPGPGQAKEESSSTEVAETITVEEETKSKVTQQFDTETQEESVKVESETVTKVNDEVKEIRRQLQEVIFKAEELEKQVADKDKEIAFLKENAKKVFEIRHELNDFVADLSDEDLLNEDKLEKARLKKRIAELEKATTVETASEEEEEKPSDEDLTTGHTEKDQIEEESSDERVSKYLKEKYGK
jgi:predicted RNA-binding Zn-ribbon protein involved in translation (DUF1610 family)